MQIVYLNGVEITRYNMAQGLTNASTFAPSSGQWGYLDPQLMGGGWLKQGANVIAAELHRSQSSVDYYFDLQIFGSREGITCAPDPVNVSIPWLQS